MKTETAISTMEAEIIAMAHISKELFPIMYVVDILGHSVGLPVGNSTINVSLHEENTGALVLEETLPPKFIPHIKNYETKTIWFYGEIFKIGINVINIDTLHQLVHFLRKYCLRKI